MLRSTQLTVMWANLLRAGVMGHGDIVGILANCAEVNGNSQDHDGSVSLVCAARRGNCPVIEELMGHSEIDTESSEKYGWTSVMLVREECIGSLPEPFASREGL
ncbi:ankyrin [Penicillium lagena]|uniref:ankyrin n=1 Tax=Penicillium lagena TaxID=94218 RepID=UPI002541F857|nr:ankyrin [Penicillium lagena]KAJ5611994.1 ankyrin [Penicillium lagena]